MRGYESTRPGIQWNASYLRDENINVGTASSHKIIRNRGAKGLDAATKGEGGRSSRANRALSVVENHDTHPSALFCGVVRPGQNASLRGGTQKARSRFPPARAPP